MYTVGKCLLADRLRRTGISQQRLAELTGIRKTQISDYVHNRRVMNIRNAKTIATVLNCHIDDLYEFVYIGIGRQDEE